MKRATLIIPPLCSFFGLTARADLPTPSESDLRGLCAPSAAVRFSCSSEKDGDIISVCFESDRLSLHFGKPGKVEVLLPQESGKESVKGWSKKYPSGVDESFSVAADLSFQKGARSYVLSHTLYDDKASGFDQLIVKESGSEIAHHRCNTEKIITGYVSDIVDEAKHLGYSVTQE